MLFRWLLQNTLRRYPTIFLTNVITKSLLCYFGCYSEIHYECILRFSLPMLLQSHCYVISICIMKYITKVTYDFYYQCYYNVISKFIRKLLRWYNHFPKNISKMKNWIFFQNLVRNPKFILDFENDIKFSQSYFDCYYECYYELRRPVVTKICPYDPGTLGSYIHKQLALLQAILTVYHCTVSKSV